MCGIAGVVERAPSSAADRAVVEAMTRTLAHRGPDAEGFFVDGRVGFGHRRLKVIDLEGGAQPLFNEDGTVVVVYNGEIYNFPALKRELESRGHVFKSRCDTEAIVHAYEEFGTDCPAYFRGMFAFALYDRKEDRLLLARDRFDLREIVKRYEALYMESVPNRARRPPRCAESPAS